MLPLGTLRRGQQVNGFQAAATGLFASTMSYVVRFLLISLAFSQQITIPRSARDSLVTDCVDHGGRVVFVARGLEIEDRDDVGAIGFVTKEPIEGNDSSVNNVKVFFVRLQVEVRPI